MQRRTAELGIRTALGATPRALVRMVLRGGLALLAPGLVVGLALVLALQRLIQSFLYEVSAADPLVLGGIGVLLVMMALVASYIPARRASKVDPMVALRYE